MNRKLVGILTLAASFTMAACDGDSLDLSGELTELESQELATVLLSTTFGSAMTPSAPGTSGPAMAPFNYSSAVDGEAPCQLGGLVDVSGNATVAGDDETGQVEMSFSLNQMHRDCVVQSDEGKRFTLNGAEDPESDHTGLTATFEMFANGEGGFEASGSLAGHIQWESDGLAGVCEISVTYSAGGNQNDGQFTATVVGSICGFSIEQQVSYGTSAA